MVVEEKKELMVKDVRYQLEPPDGGWGYLVAISTIICFTTTTAFAGTFGMIYNDFITEISMSSAAVTLLSGIFCLSVAFSGFFTSPLLTLMSVRWLAFAAAVAFALGTLGTVIMTSAVMFFIFVGILQGIGLGILFTLSCTLMNAYFTNKRVLMMSFVQTATGLNTMVAPMFIRWSLEQYGSQGTLLLIGGISLHNFIAVLLMQPVKWHMKKVEITEKTELKLLLEQNNEVKKLDTPVIKLTDIEGNSTKEALEKALELAEEYEKKSGFRKILESLIDISLIKPFLLSCVSIGPAMCTSADSIYIVMAPQYLYSMDWSQGNVAMAITLYGFGDLSTRVMFIMVSKLMFKMGLQKIYIVGIAVALMSTLGMLWSSTVIAKMVFFTLMGVAHCSIAVLVPMVISDAVAPEKFTSAMGMCFLLTGILSVALGPAIGAIRDITNSYSIAFHTVSSIYAISLVLWPIELIVKSNKRRRKIVKTNSTSSQFNKSVSK